MFVKLLILKLADLRYNVAILNLISLWSNQFMGIERTLSIIKPDATKRNLTGKINAKFEENGLKIVAQKMLKL